MSDREKLIELINEARRMCDDADCEDCTHNEDIFCTRSIIADHLISNGVTVQKWIPVSEPPKTDGSYLVATKKGAVCTAHFYKYGDVGKWSNRAIVITHWRDLPEAPVKECE